ncbi:MAG: sulfatase-like hydrolase/transferase [Cyclobacteriaceae bacterium]
MDGSESKNRVGHYFLIFALLTILLAPNLFLYFQNVLVLKLSYSTRILIRLIFAFIFFTIPLIFKFVNLRYYFYLLSPLILVSPIAFVTVYLYDILPTKWIMLGVLQTNKDEAVEFLRGFEWLAFATLFFFTGYIFVIKFWMPKRVLISFLTKRLFIAGAGLFTLLIVGWTIHLHGYKNISGHLYKRVLTLSYPFGLIHNTIQAYTELDDFNDVRFEDFSFQAFQRDTIGSRRISIVILGESSRYSNWGVNGYYRDTSPNMARRTNIITFSDMISPVPLTGLSLPLILTRATPESHDALYTEKSFLTAFKEAGYKVYWISNQPAELSTIRFINEADSYITLAGKGLFDESLLTSVKEAINSNNQNVLIVVHTQGSHYNYAKRFPKEFNVYTPSTMNSNENSKSIENGDLIMNSYDNTILYTDFVINKTIELVENESWVASVIYLSDHGEIIFDGNLDKLGHGIGTPSRYVYHIPFLFWYSDLFELKYADKIRSAKLNENDPISTINFFHSILDLNQITVNNEENSKSIFSNSYVKRPRKVMVREDELVDYDDIP